MSNKIVHCALCVVLCAGAAVAMADAEKDGGLVQIAGKGSLAVVDCGSGIDWAAMKPALDKFDTTFHIAVVRQTGAAFSVEGAAEAVRKTGANAALFIGDKAGYPLSLMASEEKWAFVNLAPLKADKAKFDKRCQVLLMRGLVRALGSDTSRSRVSCFAPVYKVTDLDGVPDLGIPMDTYFAVNESSKALGIEAIEYLTFREACELDNPPAPTNDLQRAIAAEVKAELKKQKK